MRKLLLALAFSVLSFFPASANWTGKDATPATITFYNPAVCTSVVCVPVFQLTDGTNQVTLTTAGADGVSNTLTGQPVYGRMFNFNGTTWDRWTGAVKLNATPTLANGNGVVPTQGGAVLSATNGLYANILQGNAVNSLTNPFFMSPATGAAWSITAASLPLPSLAATSTKQSDGTQKSQQVDGSGNVAPAGDTAARAGFQKLTDGTNTAAVKAASTGAVATDPSAVTNESPNSQLSVAVGTTADAPATVPTTTTAASEIALLKVIANLLNGPVPLGAATGGWQTVNTDSLTNTAVSIKASAGWLGKLYCYNPNSSAAYVQVYNIASGSVTVGTSTHAQSYGIPATSASGFTLPIVGDQYSTAISYAATTTVAGGTAPSSALNCTVSFN